MTPEKLFHELLGLGLNWEVKESRFERETGTVFLEIRETPKLWEGVRCPQDGGLVFCYDHTEVLTWRHLNVFQHRCEICDFPIQVPHEMAVTSWSGGVRLGVERAAKEFEAFRPCCSRIHWVVRRAGHAVVAHALPVDLAYAEAFSHVCCVGVDEMSVRKGQGTSVSLPFAGQSVAPAAKGPAWVSRGGAGSLQWTPACPHPGEHGHESGLSIPESRFAAMPRWCSTSQKCR